MSEDRELGRKIADRLSEGLDGLPPHVAQRLAVARAKAVARFSEVSAAPTGTAGTGMLQWLSRFGPPRLLAPVFGLVVALLIMLYWQESQHSELNYADNADLDTQMLADELPVTAYLDQGFEIWLYHQNPLDAQQ
ncbi:MAG: DUF3619 family protein [Burkholderiales bacterium]|nr:DUF3619 family protein [Burkholderiales bacterium]